MHIAVIGSGGREHALAWKLAQTEGWNSVFTLPGSDGIPNSHPIDTSDFAAIEQFCRQRQIQLIVVGPEAALAAGIVDYFRATDIAIIGATQHAAQLEGSKIWAKQFMQRHGVATAQAQHFSSPDHATAFIAQLHHQCVIKYDGLAAGKGVFVCRSAHEIQAAFAELSQQYGATFPFLVEELLVGDEISIIGITDGNSIQLLPPSQDHKQLYNNDEGANTGGMGAFCPVPFCDAALLQQIDTHIVQPTLRGLQAEQLDYKGFLYFGIMVTPQGVRTLEYNARLGDPETEVLMPALQSDLLPLLLACLQGTLAQQQLVFTDGYVVDVVMASGGYPKNYGTGYPITGLDTAAQLPAVQVFHAGTQRQTDGNFATKGGRVLNVVARAATLDQAIERAYQAVGAIQFAGAHYRTDIGKRPQYTP